MFSTFYVTKSCLLIISHFYLWSYGKYIGRLYRKYKVIYGLFIWIALSMIRISNDLYFHRCVSLAALRHSHAVRIYNDSNYGRKEINPTFGDELIENRWGVVLAFLSGSSTCDGESTFLLRISKRLRLTKRDAGIVNYFILYLYEIWLYQMT